MDFQDLVNSIGRACCVMSVERTSQGTCGEIHIICANDKYREIMGPNYYDGMPYYELVPKDTKFEDFCFRSACQGERMHAYVRTEELHCWTDQVMIPLVSDREDLGYCQFLFDFTETVDPDLLATVSIDTAKAVITNSLTLLGAGDFQQRVDDVVGNLVELTGAMRCRVIVLDDDEEEAITYSDRGLFEEEDEEARSVSIPYDIVKTWEATIGTSDGIIVKDEREMDLLAKRNPAWVADMRSFNVNSLILFPMRSDQTTIGFIYIVNFNTDKLVQIKEMLELMSYIMGSEIANFLLRQKLDQLSRYDDLTGLLNRNAMRRRIRELNEDPDYLPLGIINMDLNGLKKANDEQGHEAGDHLLKHTASCLKEIFSFEDVYRAGGDEFVAIMTHVPKEEFDEKIRLLRDRGAADPKFSLAVGPYWTEDSLEDIKTAFLNADERMYADKRIYYMNHPKEDRRSR